MALESLRHIRNISEGDMGGYYEVTAARQRQRNESAIGRHSCATREAFMFAGTGNKESQADLQSLPLPVTREYFVPAVSLFQSNVAREEQRSLFKRLGTAGVRMHEPLKKA